MITVHPTLYTIDSKGKLRTWRMETENGNHRTVSGIDGGKEVTSGWSACEAKNVGRSNSTTPAEQALAEVESQYKKKRDKKYYDKREDASGVKFFECMLAHKWKDRQKKVDLSAGVYTQPKLDGMRCIVTKDGMMSRNGKPIISAPHILESLQPLFNEQPNLVLDGELYNHELKADFDRIMELCRKSKPTNFDLIESEEMVQYHIYDIPSQGELTFGKREAFLRRLNLPMCCKAVSTYFAKSQEELDSVYAVWLEEGYEGQMIRLDLPYEGGRSNSLLKRKEFVDEEFVIWKLEEGLGNWAGAAKSAWCKTKDGKDFRAGIKGNYGRGVELLKKHREGWCPKEATIRYQNLTPDGIPRFPVAVTFWDNGRASDE